MGLHVLNIRNVGKVDRDSCMQKRAELRSCSARQSSRICHIHGGGSTELPHTTNRTKKKGASIAIERLVSAKLLKTVISASADDYD